MSGVYKKLVKLESFETLASAAIAVLHSKEDQKITPETHFLIKLLQQWLVMYLCKKLMQLMTPEALLTNHKKIPTHYISTYLVHQSHFSLRQLIESLVMSTGDDLGEIR